jgi:nicotinamide mononucleotide transporter
MPSLLEILGFFTGIAGVYLTIKRSPFCWPISALNVMLYAVIFYDAKLYADMGLQGVFLFFSVYGWYAWTKGSDNYLPDSSPLQVKQSTIKELSFGILITIPIAVILGYMLKNQTNADFPYIDSMLASLSIFAQILQTRKRLENWYIWILVDTVYILIYVSKELYLSALLYAVFLALAMQGVIEWRKVLGFATKNLSQ